MVFLLRLNNLSFITFIFNFKGYFLSFSYDVHWQLVKQYRLHFIFTVPYLCILATPTRTHVFIAFRHFGNFRDFFETQLKFTKNLIDSISIPDFNCMRWSLVLIFLFNVYCPVLMSEFFLSVFKLLFSLKIKKELPVTNSWKPKNVYFLLNSYLQYKNNQFSTRRPVFMWFLFFM